MRCDHCDQADRIPVKRAKLAEKNGRVAIVLDVPMEECPECGERWLTFEVARHLDDLLNSMLASDVEIATRHYDAADTPAA